jgi:hypothetical protein
MVMKRMHSNDGADGVEVEEVEHRKDDKEEGVEEEEH